MSATFVRSDGRWRLGASVRLGMEATTAAEFGALLLGQCGPDRFFHPGGQIQRLGQGQGEFGARGQVDLRLRKVDDRGLDDPFGDRSVQLAAKK